MVEGAVGKPLKGRQAGGQAAFESPVVDMGFYSRRLNRSVHYIPPFALGIQRDAYFDA